jgi:hypothetical protein
MCVFPLGFPTAVVVHVFQLPMPCSLTCLDLIILLISGSERKLRSSSLHYVILSVLILLIKIRSKYSLQYPEYLCICKGYIFDVLGAMNRLLQAPPPHPSAMFSCYSILISYHEVCDNTDHGRLLLVAVELMHQLKDFRWCWAPPIFHYVQCDFQTIFPYVIIVFVISTHLGR